MQIIGFLMRWLTLSCFLQTFRPKKKFDPGTLKFNLHKQANASLNSGIDLKEVVRLPPGEDLNDWVAVHGKHIVTDCPYKAYNAGHDNYFIIWFTNYLLKSY